MSGRSFSFRLDAQGAEQVVGAFRQVAGQSEELRRAYDRLIQASPQLASVHDGVQAKLRQTAEGMRRTGEAARDAERPFAEFGGSLTRAGLVGMGVGAGIELFNQLREAVVAAVAAIPQAGDAAMQAMGRLTALTGSQTAGSEIYSRIQQIAATTGSTIQDTTEAFTRFRVAAQELGATNEQVLTLIENFQKFAVVNGAGGAGLSAATTQLAQALASGKLQGDELRSIMENLPQLAQGLARELGVGIGRLREMGTEGKLSSEVVFPALQRMLAGIGAEFDRMPSSIARARNEMDVAATKLFETLDRSFGLSGAVVRRFEQLARVISGIEGTIRTVTQSESQFTAARERGALREELGAFDATIAEARAQANPDQDAIAQLVARRDTIARVLRQKDEEAERERRRASEAAHQAAVARTGSQIKEIMDLDKRAAADRQLEERRRVILERFTLTGDAAEMDRATALAVKDHADAVEKLTEKTRAETVAVREATDATSRYLEARRRVTEDARAVELALDPQAAAWQRTAEKVEKLTAAMQLYEDTAGAQGMSPDRAGALIVRLQEGLIDNFDKIERGAQRTDGAFERFFSNATSRFEDAISRGARLRDIINGIGEDLARMIIRSTITQPLAGAASSLLSPIGNSLSGFFSNLFSGGGGAAVPGAAIAMPFAMGGIMSSAGPLPLRSYAGGGVANTPQLALFGEGRTPEAYVPLPDGRSIPVTMSGGASIRGGDVIVQVQNTGADPQQIAAVVRTAVDQSHRELVEQINRGGTMAKIVGRRQ